MTTPVATTTQHNLRSRKVNLPATGSPPPPPPGGGGGGPPDDGDDDNPEPGPLPPEPVPFALTPAHTVAYDQVINYSTRYGQHLFDTATKPLHVIYDCTSDGLQDFIDAFKQRATVANWDYTLTIAKGHNTYHLAENYGMLSVADITRNTTRYIRQPTRDAQNSEQMYVCLRASLTKQARNKVASRKNEFVVHGKADGPLYFKAITRTAQVDNQFTISYLEQRLCNLAAHMQEVGQDIERFNQDVTQWCDDLYARCAPVKDSTLITNLFIAYRACSDRDFLLYINQQRNSYNDRQAISPNELMHRALNQYNILRAEKAWMQPTEEAKKIMALTAELNQLKNANKKKEKGGKKADDGSKKKGKDGKGSDKKGDKPEKKREYPAWKKVPPKDGEPTTKTVNGKVYHWCLHHNIWTAHQPSDCKLQKKDKKGDGTKPTLQVNTTLAAIAANDEDDE